MNSVGLVFRQEAFGLAVEALIAFLGLSILNKLD